MLTKIAKNSNCSPLSILFISLSTHRDVEERKSETFTQFDELAKGWNAIAHSTVKSYIL